MELLSEVFDTEGSEHLFLKQDYFEYDGSIFNIEHLIEESKILISNGSKSLCFSYKVIGKGSDLFLSIYPLNSDQYNTNQISEIMDAFGHKCYLPIFISQQEETTLNSFGISNNILDTLLIKNDSEIVETFSYDLINNFKRLDKIIDYISVIDKSILSYALTISDHNVRQKSYKNLFEKIENKRALVMLSGGIDSTILFYLSRQLGLDTGGIQFIYKDRPKIENQLVKKLQKKEKFSLYEVEYPWIIDYKKKLKIDIQENNLIYYSLASAIAEREGYDYVIAGQILSDRLNLLEGKIYNEAAPKIYSDINLLLEKAYGINKVKILTPFIFLNKNRVVEIGKNLNVPFELTWSCPEDGFSPCGKCQQCIERKTAFETHNINID